MGKVFTPTAGTFLLIAVTTTFLALQITLPAMNTGDYWRVLWGMSLNVTPETSPAACIAYTDIAPHEGLKSALAVFGWIVSSLNRMLGNTCLSMDAWFLSLSTLYWLGAFFAIRDARGVNLVLRSALLVVFFLTFSGPLKSFYEEAFLVAISPWLALLAGQRNPSLLLFAPVVFLALITKAQAIFFAPVFLFIATRMYLENRSIVKTGLATTIVALGCVYALSYSYVLGSGTSNAFNRIYTGIGYARLDAGTWPAVDAGGLHLHFAAHQDTFSADTRSMCAPGDLNLMGVNFWLGGYQLEETPVPIEGDYDTADFLSELGFDDFFACFARETSVAQYLGAIYPIFFRFSYTSEYAFPPAGDGPVLGAVSDARQSILRHFPKLAAVAFVLLILAFRGVGRSAVAAYALLAAPVFVVLGDGFVEFEKHMLINLAFLICPAFLFLTDDATESG